MPPAVKLTEPEPQKDVLPVGVMDKAGGVLMVPVTVDTELKQEVETE